MEQQTDDMYITGCGHVVCGSCKPRLEETRRYSEPEATRVNQLLGLLEEQGSQGLVKYGGAIRCPVCREAAVCLRAYV
jgi:hypothetical protein